MATASRDRHAELVHEDIGHLHAGKFTPDVAEVLVGGGHDIDVEHLLAAVVLVMGHQHGAVDCGVPPGDDGEAVVVLRRQHGRQAQQQYHGSKDLFHGWISCCQFFALSLRRDTPTRTGDPLVPNQVRYQLRHIPIDNKDMKKIWLITENPLSLHSPLPRDSKAGRRGAWGLPQ